MEPEGKTRPCCGRELHAIGEDVSKRLNKVPAKVRVILTRRAKYACRTCEKTGADEVDGIIQAAVPARLVEGGLPTEAFVADVVVSPTTYRSTGNVESNISGKMLRTGLCCAGATSHLIGPFWRSLRNIIF
jgi:hypothetical protein